MENNDIIKSKDEEILKLRKLASIFKNECKKLKEENEYLKKDAVLNTKEISDNTNDEDIILKFKNEFSKRIVIEKSYKKLKEFTLLLEKKIRNQKNENIEKCKVLEDKLNECNKNLKISKSENENLKEKIKEKDLTIHKLNDKIEEFRMYMKGEKDLNSLESKIDETIEYKLEIKKLKDNIDILKKNDEITSKERQQYKNMIILCSQYKEKCKKLPILESKIDILENKIKELELYKIRDKEKFENIKELKNCSLKQQIENNKLKEQLNEWINFSKIYINNKEINVDNLKISMNEIYNKYNQVNSTKTDLEVKYKKLSIDIEIYKQNLDDKILELKIIENRHKQLEKKYEFLKRDYINEVNKNISSNKNNSSNKDHKIVENKEEKEEKGEGEEREEYEKQQQKKNENIVKMLNDYKLKYDSIKSDNIEKEKLIEELYEKIKKYKNEYEKCYLKQKNSEVFSQELLLYEKEIKYLKEEIDNYKNKILNLENDLVHVNNQWNHDNEKNEIIINELKESIKKVQFDNKIKNNVKKNNEITNEIHNKMYDINILYKDIDDLKTYDQIELTTLRNENLYLKSKIEVIKFFYSNQIKNYREAFLYILGWDIQIEQSNEEIFFILTSLFSTHDGQFIFIKNKCINEKRSYENQNENCRSLKKMRLEHNEQKPTEFDTNSENKKNEIEKEKETQENEEDKKKNPNEENEEKNKNYENFSGTNENNNIEENFYDGIINERNEIDTNTIIQKSKLKDTNINMATIMKGSKYNLLLNGYYSIKWQENIEWRKYINKINTYPILLSLSCIEEYNFIKSQYNNSLSKNYKGMLFKI
ncbi:conserved Plasmodium protein, unknown function [Plasmodium relictum]|uniref:Uncharacterized protein n=1 Tax=Plasmodium relictum TaxID=85471 RepID=A0A1J1H169_PLARL|nr:conserved Plasmodium protein, unknown function [Plasmodium relictum]CRG98594.1 conserved Plasmodium protein, unknown function [Plasmodium relictum]